MNAEQQSEVITRIGVGKIFSVLLSREMNQVLHIEQSATTKKHQVSFVIHQLGWFSVLAKWNNPMGWVNPFRESRNLSMKIIARMFRYFIAQIDEGGDKYNCQQMEDFSRHRMESNCDSGTETIKFNHIFGAI